MSLLKIRNWETWQTYRKDRGTPPWIKIYRRLLLDPQWNTLTDAQKGQLVSLWVLAGDRNGIIPDDTRMLRKLCQLDSDPDVSTFISLGFIDRLMATKKRNRDNQEVKTCQPLPRQSDAPEKSREEKRREEEIAPRGAPEKTKRATQLPPDFKPSQALLDFAWKIGLEAVVKETEAFEDYHRSKGSTFKDWDAAWRTWMRNAKKFERKPYAKPAESDKIRKNLETLRDFAGGSIREGPCEDGFALPQPRPEPGENSGMVRDPEGFERG